ncbi:hypothetical protein GCM10017687_34150 [Streptomyces echinatus]
MRRRPACYFREDQAAVTPPTRPLFGQPSRHVWRLGAGQLPLDAYNMATDDGARITPWTTNNRKQHNTERLRTSRE